MRFNAAPINGRAGFNGDVPNVAPLEIPSGGGASFPFGKGRRGTALFATAHQPEVEKPSVGDRTPVAAAVHALETQGHSHNTGPNVLRQLISFTDELPVQTEEKVPARQAVDIVLVHIDMTILRLQMDMQARLQAEEDDAIALLMLSEA